jgi:hypothetical protein
MNVHEARLWYGYMKEGDEPTKGATYMHSDQYPAMAVVLPGYAHGAVNLAVNGLFTGLQL